MVREDKLNVILQELVRRANSETQRFREFEQRLQSIEERTRSLEDSSLEKAKKFSAKLAELEALLRSIDAETVNIKNNLERVNKQLTSFARRRDVLEIEKMLDLLAPVRAVEE